MADRDPQDSPMVRIDRVRLRRIRQLKGYNQAQLAELAGVSFGYIAHIERGQRPNVSPGVFVRLCDALDVQDRTELINDTEQSAA